MVPNEIASSSSWHLGHSLQSSQGSWLKSSQQQCQLDATIIRAIEACLQGLKERPTLSRSSPDLFRNSKWFSEKTFSCTIFRLGFVQQYLFIAISNLVPALNYQVLSLSTLCCALKRFQSGALLLIISLLPLLLQLSLVAIFALRFKIFGSKFSWAPKKRIKAARCCRFY